MRNLIVGILLVTAAPLGAQSVERVTLASPEATFPEPFSRIAGLRQLSDGRLVIADLLEQAVRFVDFKSGVMDDIGHVGGGPGEYQMPSGLLPLPADSTLLIDFGNMRMSVIAPDGRIAGSTSLMRGEALFVRPTGADARGGLYFDQGGVRLSSGGRIESVSTQPIARLDLASDRIDTVAAMPRVEQPRVVRSMSMRGGRMQIAGLTPYPTQNVWAVAPDGRIAIVHADPYHVEWISSSGPSISGTRVEYRPVRVTDRDKEAWADRMGDGSALMVMVDGGGGRGGGRAMRVPRPDPDDMEWPEFKPAFDRRAARVTPGGELWVQRHVAFSEPATYDVFDDSGDRVRQVVLPEGRQLVGFGDGMVFLVNVDEDDLQWLEAYRMP